MITPETGDGSFNGIIRLWIGQSFQFFEDKGGLFNQARPRSFIHFGVNFARFLVKIYLLKLLQQDFLLQEELLAAGKSVKT